MKYLHEFRDRHGKWRRYFRRHGKSTALPGEPGSPEFLSAYAAALKTSGHSTRAARPARFTMSALIESYQTSLEFRQLRPSTQATYQGILRRLADAHGTKSALRLSRTDVIKLLNELTPGAAMQRHKLLRLLCRHMLDLDWREDDPTIGVRKPKAGSGFAEWSDDDLAKFEAAYASGTMERLAYALLLYLGQRRGDTWDLGRQHIRRGKFHITQSKGRKRVVLPIIDELSTELAYLPADQLQFLPFRSKESFGNWFNGRCKAAGIDKTAHGLRRSCLRRLAEVEATDRELMAASGHSTASEITRYTRDAEQERMADTAFGKLTRTRVANRDASD